MKNRKGFTLVELVVLLLLIGIIAIFVAPRMLNITSTEAGAFADKLRADIRYAQNTAMTTNRRARVYFNGTAPPPVIAPNPGYAAGIDNSALGNCGTFAFLPDPTLTGNLVVALNTGDYAGITVASAITNCLEYDSLGRPYDCSANLNVCSPTPLAAVMNIVVNANGNLVETVTIAPQTGAVN